jgi:hypothetical protein
MTASNPKYINSWKLGPPKLLKPVAFTFLGLLLLMGGVANKEGIFSIQPQPIGGKQWAYIVVTLVSYLVLFLLYFLKRSKYGLYVFFVFYPFLAQSAYYLNISSSFFILTPSIFYLGLLFALTREPPLNRSFLFLLLFCLSTFLSILPAANKYTAATFVILAVGDFAIIASITYNLFKSSHDPFSNLRGVIYSIILGSATYFILETIAFQIRPADIVNVILRRWGAIPSGRYYTGGYWEPAGLGFVYSYLFWILVFLVQQSRYSATSLQKGMDRIAFLIVIIFLMISGTRSAIITLVLVFLVLLALRYRTGIRSFVRLKPVHVLTLLIIACSSAYLLIPRTIQTSRTPELPSWIEPTVVTIGSRDFVLVGTTADYYNQTISSLRDFLTNPLGSGPLNANPLKDTQGGGVAYYYSFLSNLIVIGATFGWLALLIWIVFIVHVARRVFRLKYFTENTQIYAMILVFLAVLFASLLPGGYFLGPNLNWSNFSRLLPLSPSTPSVPADYPAVISGFIIGAFIGLIERSYKVSQEIKATND